MKKTQTLTLRNLVILLAFLHQLVAAQNALCKQKTILFVRKSGNSFQEVFNKMSEDMKNYEIKDFEIADKTDFNEYSTRVKETNPDLVILMDNKSINFGVKWNSESNKKIPGVALMGLNLQYLLKNNKYISGIAFESPAYTLITQFRYSTNVPIKTVLVFYRKSIFSEMINLASSQLKTENITLRAIDVEANGTGKDQIETFLKGKGAEAISKRSDYDAIWCLLDSAILTSKLFQEFWIPNTQSSKKPVLAGVEQLVKPELNFGVFAVNPNLPDLATQAVQIVERILEQKESPEKIGIEQLISVDKVLNDKKVKELDINVDPEKSSDVKILK
jgi:hypothetical protein